MQNFSCWVKHYIFEWNYLRSLPTSKRFMVQNFQHMVCKMLSKLKSCYFWFFLQLFRRSKLHRQICEL
jgi:hypothetical protein